MVGCITKLVPTQTGSGCTAIFEVVGVWRSSGRNRAIGVGLGQPRATLSTADVIHRPMAGIVWRLIGAALSLHAKQPLIRARHRPWQAWLHGRTFDRTIGSDRGNPRMCSLGI